MDTPKGLKRVRLLNSITHSIGACLCIIYFNVIRWQGRPLTGEDFRTVILFSLLMAGALVIGANFAVSYYLKPIKAFLKDGRLLVSKERLFKMALNFPVIGAAFGFFFWLVAGLSISSFLLARGLVTWGEVWSVFFGITIISGGCTNLVAFLGSEYLWRPSIPHFLSLLPGNEILRYKSFPLLRVGPRLLFYLLIIGLLPVTLLAVLTFGQISELPLLVSENIKDFLLRYYLFLMAIFLAMVLGISFLLTRLITAPVFSLAKGFKKIAEGDYKTGVLPQALDELGLLQINFNKLTETLKKKEAELKALNRNLDEKVARRTAELTKANEELRRAFQELRDAQDRIVTLEKEALKDAVTIRMEIDDPGLKNGLIKALDGYFEFMEPGDAKGKIVSPDVILTDRPPSGEGGKKGGLRIMSNSFPFSPDTEPGPEPIFEALGDYYGFGTQDFRFITISRNMNRILSYVRDQAAPLDETVLIQGESGTGKELVARLIHASSKRKDGPFVAFNCGGLAEQLIESELFGHKKGAFTGAIKEKRGKLEMAQQGSVFLDEVGDLKPEIQVKFLRVLQEKEIEPLGSTSKIKVNIRVIAATNRRLEDDVRSGKFREDLFYRLNVLRINLIPLRERKKDISLLVYHFLQKFNQRNRRRIRLPHSQGMMWFKLNPWPGNVRELENAIYRMASHARDNQQLPVMPIKEEDEMSSAIHPGIENYTTIIDKVSHSLIEKALEIARGNQKKTASLLEIDYSKLRREIRRLGINTGV